MNKKRKILTVAAMVAFGLIIVFHYCSFDTRTMGFSSYPGIEDIHMPLFVLAVLYAGLFAILSDNKRKEKRFPRSV